jgi:tryptophanase
MRRRMVIIEEGTGGLGAMEDAINAALAEGEFEGIEFHVLENRLVATIMFFDEKE